MDFTTIATAVITGVVTFAGFLITNSKNQAVLDERIRSLTRAVERHNSVIERTYKLESDMSTMWKRYDELRPYADIARHAETRAETAHDRLDRLEAA